MHRYFRTYKCIYFKMYQLFIELSYKYFANNIIAYLFSYVPLNIEMHCRHTCLGNVIACYEHVLNMLGLCFRLVWNMFRGQ